MRTTDGDRGQITDLPKAAISSVRRRTFWPTPNTPSGGGNLMSTPKHTGGIDLEGAAELWQTPATDSFRSRGGDRKDEMGLDQQARLQWGTPASRDWKGANSELHVTETGGGGAQNAHESTEQPGRALFPPGPGNRDAWREIIRERPDLAPAIESEVRGVASGATGGMDFSRADQLRSLGNLVVPLQGALALLVLLDRDATEAAAGGE
jgi:hypothetical protein